ncbi:MAG: hypothetical protein E6K82_20125 [Candidatus Rokuibacteriota bacterium]|nr:MAG: hypothetical protein E6K82_20125 [Candidatus Rokubacteria bacterium]
MNPRMLGVIALAIMSSGCVVRAVGPRPVVVAQPAVVVAQPPAVMAPPPQVVVEPIPVVIAPPVLLAPPAVVLVPGTQVYTASTASFNVFVYGGRYYSYHHGQWFHAPRHGAAWTPVAVTAVPVQVRAVPVKHYKIPPGQEKKIERAEREERAERCPPGLAKKGQC